MENLEVGIEGGRGVKETVRKSLDLAHPSTLGLEGVRGQFWGSLP